MPNYKPPLKLKIRASLRSIVAIFSRPHYILLALAVSFIALGILVWLTNRSLLASVIGDPVFSFTQKLEFYWSGYTSLATNYSMASASVLVLFAVLSGINAAMLAFVVSRSYKEAVAGGGKNILAIAAAAIGAGCAACGTSFLAPVLTGVAGGLSITLTTVVGIIANIAGVGLLLYSIFQLGVSAASYLVNEKKS